jgi:acetyl/propionyl-CoA carboxylase alpha subunit
MKDAVVSVRGRRSRVLYLASSEGLWFHLDGETYFAEKPKAGKTRRKEEGRGGNITAPMPGKVTKVLAKPGDTVAERQTLVVMEAMKMEYNLKAGAAGKVKAVHCLEGEQVTQDRCLVEFEDEKSDEK